MTGDQDKAPSAAEFERALADAADRIGEAAADFTDGLQRWAKAIREDPAIKELMRDWVRGMARTLLKLGQPADAAVTFSLHDWPADRLTIVVGGGQDAVPFKGGAVSVVVRDGRGTVRVEGQPARQFIMRDVSPVVVVGTAEPMPSDEAMIYAEADARRLLGWPPRPVLTVMDDFSPYAWAAPPPLARHRHHPVEDWRTGPRRRRQPRKNP